MFENCRNSPKNRDSQTLLLSGGAFTGVSYHSSSGPTAENPQLVRVTDGHQVVFLATHEGHAIRFDENDVPHRPGVWIRFSISFSNKSYRLKDTTLLRSRAAVLVQKFSAYRINARRMDLPMVNTGGDSITRLGVCRRDARISGRIASTGSAGFRFTKSIGTQRFQSRQLPWSGRVYNIR